MSPTKRPRRAAARKQNASSSSTAYTTPRQAKYPPWIKLPYFVLVDIFEYASINTQVNWQGIDHTWLFKAALTCKSWSVPAINVLYRSPPTAPSVRLRKFYEAVKANPELGDRIRRIEAPSAEILDSKLLKFEFHQLVGMAKNLTELCIATGPYNSPLLLHNQTRKFELPVNAIEALQENGVKLRNWTWDGELCWAIAAHYDPDNDTSAKKIPKQKRGFKWLDVMHKDMDVFKALRALTMTNFSTPEYPDIQFLDEESEARKVAAEVQIATIAGALGHLKYLKGLAFKDCNFVNSYFFSQMAGSHQLTRLVLEELKNINAADVQNFLQQNGKNLEELEIIHCPEVMMGFLNHLDTSTPNLKLLLYEDIPGLVSAEELELLDLPMPRWPERLESLVMRSLGNWTAADCERILEGMVETARNGGFKNLGELDVWCILPELSWRDRAASRKKWGDEFAMAFLDRRGKAWKEFVAKKKAEGQKINLDGNDSVGLCEKVLFRLDDSRPTGNQLNEDDFLDLDTRPAKKLVRKAPSTAKKATPKKKGKQAAVPKGIKSTPTKRKRSQKSQSFIVGAKRRRYDSDEDADFKVDQLAYEDEDGNDSSWSVDDE